MKIKLTLLNNNLTTELFSLTLFQMEEECGFFIKQPQEYSEKTWPRYSRNHLKNQMELIMMSFSISLKTMQSKLRKTSLRCSVVRKLMNMIQSEPNIQGKQNLFQHLTTKSIEKLSFKHKLKALPSFYHLNIYLQKMERENTFYICRDVLNTIFKNNYFSYYIFQSSLFL